ncbi:MAG: hypothetical protein KKF30_01850 [Proteobacteria bacterium]|nr:hypothetical protein [Pseudomonadota bacterium]MBU4471488.1 hypothetical protein [Pseudomonadota bacterium]MCG2752494.1 hypothetical protein [Desulfobacteraceae bacterium]
MLITQLKPGMVIAEDALNFQGLLLLKANTVITEKNLKMLKSWGVTSVNIDGQSGENRQEKNQSLEGLKLAVDEEMKERFSKSLDNPVMEEILAVATDIKIQKRMQNG